MHVKSYVAGLCATCVTSLSSLVTWCLDASTTFTLLWFFCFFTISSLAVSTTITTLIQRVFSREIRVNQYQNVSVLDYIGAKDVGGGGDNWNCKICKAKAPAELSPSACYRLDALPVTHPTVSKHWRESLLAVSSWWIIGPLSSLYNRKC